jgi:hypothetical protein
MFAGPESSWDTLGLASKKPAYRTGIIMREFEGIEITNDFVDDLVEEWHENEKIMPTPLHQFVISNTGWSIEEYTNWMIHGVVPD